MRLTRSVMRANAQANVNSLLRTFSIVQANGVLPITVFLRDRSTSKASLFRCLIQKVVAMLAEIFMLRLEAKARLVEEVLPSSASQFIPFSPMTQFTFKETDLKAKEAPREERPVSVVR